MKKQTPIKAILMTGAEYAAHRGVKPQRISALKARGGLIVMNGKIDQAASDALLDSTESGDGEETLLKAQRRKESALASLRELDLKQKSGELINIGEVERFVANMGQTFRDAVLSLPERIAQNLAALTDPLQVRDTLRKEVRTILENVQATFHQQKGQKT